MGTGRQVVGTGRIIRKRIEAGRKEKKTTLGNCLGIVCYWKLFLWNWPPCRMLPLKDFWIRIKDNIQL